MDLDESDIGVCDKIVGLPTIEDLRNQLSWLPHSTQLRNALHLLQLREFYMRLLIGCGVNRGLRNNHLYNIMRLNADIIESILFCESEYRKEGAGKGKKLQALINYSKTWRIIPNELADNMEAIRIYRNELHPEKQIELFVKVSQEELNRRLNVPIALINVIKEDHGIENHIEEEAYEPVTLYERDETTLRRCPYCSGVAELFERGDLCPICGKIIGFD